MPTANNQVVTIEIQANGHTGVSVTLVPYGTEQFEGTTVPTVLIGNGILGTAYPLDTHNWDWIAGEEINKADTFPAHYKLNEFSVVLNANEELRLYAQTTTYSDGAYLQGVARTINSKLIESDIHFSKIVI